MSNEKVTITNISDTTNVSLSRVSRKGKVNVERGKSVTLDVNELLPGYETVIKSFNSIIKVVAAGAQEPDEAGDKAGNGGDSTPPNPDEAGDGGEVYTLEELLEMHGRTRNTIAHNNDIETEGKEPEEVAQLIVDKGVKKA